MIQSIFIGIALLASLFGLTKTPTPIWDTPGLQLGATNFPSSLDSLTNPSGTDSVSTVSHSGQHSNANDALEALEAKLRIDGTISGGTQVLVSDGTRSVWSSVATTTNLTVNASTTLQNFTFGNATGTSATTTNSFATTASTTNLWGTNINGFSLSSCTGSNRLQWSGGLFSCASAAASDVTVFSTTTAQQMATTTFTTANGSLPTTKTIEIRVTAPDVVGSALTDNSITMTFNGDNTKTYAWSNATNGAGDSATPDDSRITLSRLAGNGPSPQQTLKIEIYNITGTAKRGFADFSGYATTTTQSRSAGVKADFIWENTAALTQVDIAYDTQNTMFGTSTIFEIFGH